MLAVNPPELEQGTLTGKLFEELFLSLRLTVTVDPYELSHVPETVAVTVPLPLSVIETPPVEAMPGAAGGDVTLINGTLTEEVLGKRVGQDAERVNDVEPLG